LCLHKCGEGIEGTGDSIDRLILKTKRSTNELRDECRRDGQLISNNACLTQSHLAQHNVKHDWMVSVALGVFAMSMSVVMSYLYDFDIGQRTACIDRLNGTQTARTASARLALRLAAKDLAVSENVKLLFFVNTMPGFLTLAATILTIPIEIRVFMNEHRNRWYSTGAYYWSKCLVELPVLVAIGLIYSSMVYFISDQESDAFRWAYFTMIVTGGVCTAASIANLIGIIFCPNDTLSTTLGVGFYILIFLFNGFAVRLPNAEWFIRKVTHISYLRFTFYASIISIYGYDRCESGQMNLVLNKYHLDDDDMWENVNWLIGHLVVLRLLGLLALMFKVSISNKCSDNSDNINDNKVVLRCHDHNEWQAFINEKNVLTISLLLSAKGLAPKVLGVFDTGIILEFIDGRYFSASDDQNPIAVSLLGQKLAKLHSMEMPVIKDNSQNRMNSMFSDNYFSPKMRQSLKEGAVYEEIMRNNYQTFHTLDLSAEMSWLKPIILDLKSPIVFIHNDFNRKNILIRETNNENLQQMDIYLIDFDFSSYNYRGIDFGTYFSSWCHREIPYGFGEYPTDDQMLVFIDAYIREMTAINGNSFTQLEINSRQRLIKEAKKSADNMFKCYHNLKTRMQLEYKFGKWANVGEEDLIIRHNSDGFINKIYYCFLPEDSNYAKSNDNKVVLRCHDHNEWQAFISEKNVLTISLLLSAKGLAPKVLGVFDTGIILEFIDGRYFGASDDINPRAVLLLGKKLATLHSMEMPVIKDNSQNRLNGILGDNYFDHKLRQSFIDGLVYKEIHKHHYKALQTLDLLAEMSWLKKIIVDLKSPIVFSHNDFNRKNILIHETNDGNSQQMDIYLIDFDFSSYNYRGVDFGTYFSSWCQQEIPFGCGDFPTDGQLLVFINAYIEGLTAINGNYSTQLKMDLRYRLIKERQEQNDWFDYFDANQVLAIQLITSQLGLAPKILGCRYFTGSDDHNPRALALLAQRLARLHTTEMPVPKDNTKMWLN
ncbi:unnamed protein product, partial [Medioppia subpectinata]